MENSHKDDAIPTMAQVLTMVTLELELELHHVMSPQRDIRASAFAPSMGKDSATVIP
ncbi:MAG: hypothetical protein MK168_02085 [Candidatus Thalassarchaeum sp.]|nr:hypothetical protein [Candidatus Thalassarchaeum sp.]